MKMQLVIKGNVWYRYRKTYVLLSKLFGNLILICFACMEFPVFAYQGYSKNLVLNNYWSESLCIASNTGNSNNKPQRNLAPCYSSDGITYVSKSSQLIRNYSGFLRCVHFDNVHNFNTDTGEVMRIHICKRTGITWSKVSLGFVV